MNPKDIGTPESMVQTNMRIIKPMNNGLNTRANNVELGFILYVFMDV
jgi:hypothetical protein